MAFRFPLLAYFIGIFSIMLVVGMMSATDLTKIPFVITAGFVGGAIAGLQLWQTGRIPNLKFSILVCASVSSVGMTVGTIFRFFVLA